MALEKETQDVFATCIKSIQRLKDVLSKIDFRKIKKIPIKKNQEELA